MNAPFENPFKSLRRARPRQRNSPPFRRKILFEALEPRLLLSADVSPSLADALAASLAPANSQQQETALPLQDTTPVLITSALDASADADPTAASWIIDLDDGTHALQASGDTDNEWRITGADSGTLNGVAFSGIGTLLGGAGNQDTFILEQGGSLSGYLDGGPGGFDSMVIAGGSAETVQYTATGPDSGFVQLGETTIEYRGLEPITDNSSAVNRVLSASASSDQITLMDGPASGQLTLQADNGTFESHTFAAPSASLRINAGDGDDTINLQTLLEYSGALYVDGGAGDDTIDLSGLAGSWTVIGHSDGSFTITDGFDAIGAVDVELFTGPHSVLFESGVPSWQEQGPGPITNAQLVLPPNNIVSGAIQSIATYGFDPNLLYVGTVNGGVWRTSDRTVFFDHDSTALSADAQAILDQYAVFLLSRPTLAVEVGGHTDSSGDASYNLTLAHDRAQAVADYLTTAGVPAAQLTVVSYGETRLIADDGTVAGQELNRRVELITHDWQPLTDQFPSLAISSVAVSPLDSAGAAVAAGTPLDELVIYAGTGSFSNYGSEGGAAVGLLRSSDGGESWSLVAGDDLGELRITSVVPTAQTTVDGQVVLVSTLSKVVSGAVVKTGGVFRSTDGGDSFAPMLIGAATDLVADPGDPMRFYAAVKGQGVYRSDDAGATWTLVNTGLTLAADGADNNQDGTADNAAESAAGANRIVLAVQQDAASATNSVYAALIGSNRRLMGLFRSTDFGANWAPLGAVPAVPSVAPVAGQAAQPQVNMGGQANTNFSLAVDAGGNVFMGGDADNNTGLAALWWRSSATGLWNPLFGAAASNTTPHADSRDMAFDVAGRLLESSDGGINRLVNPRGLADADGNGSAGPARSWESMNGNLRVSEVLSAAYDPVNNLVFAGMQDNGSNAQAAGLGAWVDANGDGLPDDAATRFVWSQVLGGDGNTQQAVVIDLNSDGLDNDGMNGVDDGNEFRVERFSLANNWGFFDAGPDGVPGNADDVFYGVYRAALYDAAGNQISSTNRGLFAPGAGADGVLGTFDDTQTGRAGSGLTDPADASFNSFWPIPYVGNAVDPNSMIIGLFGLYESPNRLSTISNIFNSGLGAGANVTVPGNTFTALAYGGREGATLKPDVIYAARGSQILVRETNSTGTQADFTTRPVPGASEIRGVAIDPDDWHIAYAVDKDKVYKTIDAGAHWDVISDRLGATDLKTVTVVKTSGGDKALLVGAQLGVYRALNPVVDVEWTEFGSGLPNALVRDIDFALQPASGTGVLLAGTQGRGAWITAGDASTILGDPGALVIGGTSGDDEVLVLRDGANTSLLDVYVNSLLPVFTLPIDSVSSITFAGSDGADTLTVDSGFGPISVPGGIHFDGGDGLDTLILDGGKVVSDTQTTDAGVTQVETVDFATGATQLVSYENVETFTDNLPQASDLEKVGSGLGDFFDWLDHLGDPGEGADQSLAALGSSLLRALITGPVEPSAEPAGGPQVAGSGPGEAMDSLEGLRRLVETGTGAFDLGAIGGVDIATYDALRDALDALDATGGNASYTQVGDTTTFTAQVVKTLGGTADLDVGFDLFGGRVDLHGTMDIGADVEVNLQFGFDSQGFFIDTGASGEELLVHNITLDGDAEAAGRFGFLDVVGSVDSLTFDNDVQLAVDLQEPGGDGKLRLADLGTSLGASVAVSVAGDASADDVTLVASMSAAAIIPGIDAIDLGGAQVTVAWADVTQPDTVSVSASAGLGQDLLDFLRVDVQQVIDQLDQVHQLADTLNIDIPFLSDAFDQIVGFVDDFNSRVIQPLTSPVSGGASFSSVQNLATRLASSLGVDPAALGLDFDAVSKELTYHLQLAKDFSVSQPLGSAIDFGNGLGGLEFSTDASVDGSFTLDVDFGLDLGAIASAADPGEWFFIRDPHAVATLDVAASDVTAAAHIGFLAISVEGGSVSASPTIDVTLNDPGTHAADGRIDIGELLDGLASPGTFINATLGGAASANLPIVVDVGLGGFLDPNIGTVEFSASDLFDTGTYSINFDGDFSNAFQFNDLSATQLLSMIGQLTDQLDALRNTAL
ncbi:MAG TPA: OmpA family protein, partial [Burkholderiales bacterium]|nr:OmpA family protein [Burkholderiales bacterium]